ncbi:hypothetical protein LZZ85_11895 [Terrimonas sp. NA20]|uniref:DUF5117 domain-containing protein n=1 Tax=Terrimonas ginsenosidimutans TaxID=2908004 RepID=A0ABS9KRM9_9BACT|nr:hypothetical protein [Terrimonas ginsenosidimutans]MCG2614992.1 hypothetical protein [Terrimonas ginsenosidimutans]
MQFITRNLRAHGLMIILLFFSVSGFGQWDEPKLIPMKLSAGPAIGSLPAAEFLVHDVRFDTSSIGLEESAQELRLIKLAKGFHGTIANFITTRAPLDKNNPFTLHCFIKKMMLSNHIYLSSTEDKQKKFDMTELPGILFAAELYLQDNNTNLYTPVFRFDTTITGNRQVNYGGGQSYTEAALDAFVQKMVQANWDKHRNNARKLEPKQLNEHYTRRFGIPVLKNPEPVRGLYLSYDDFRNNKPTVIDFTVEEGSKGDFLYIKNDKGDQILQHELWGYCDGKDMFIYSASNYFKLQRSANGFIIYGAKDYTARRALRLNFSAVDLISPNSNYSKGRTRTKYHLDQSFLQLDMETGELF